MVSAGRLTVQMAGMLVLPTPGPMCGGGGEVQVTSCRVLRSARSGLASRYITPSSPLSGGQRTSLLGALPWPSGQAPVVAGRPDEGDQAVAGCSLGGPPHHSNAARVVLAALVPRYPASVEK